MFPKYKRGRIVLFLFAVIFYCRSPVFAQDSWIYGISTDTTSVIDTAASNVHIDTALHEITLPNLAAPNLLAISPEGMEWAVLTNTGVKVFTFDGSEMRENTLLSIETTNPVGLALPLPYPSTVVADKTSIRQYLFDGSEMVEAPALGVAGLTNVVSVSSINNDTIAVLDGNTPKVYQFTGSDMTENTILEPQTPLDNPVALAMDSGFNIAVLEQNRVRYFNYYGSGMIENPALEITGITNPKTFSMQDREIAIVQGTEVNHYSFDGNSMVSNSALSITSGLSDRRDRHWTWLYDRVILDGDTVKYYNQLERAWFITLR